MPNGIHGNVGTLEPRETDAEVFSRASTSGRDDVRLVYDPKSGSLGEQSRKGGWSSKLLRGFVVGVSFIGAVVGSFIAYGVLKGKAKKIKEGNRTTVDRFLATMERAYRAGDADPRFEQLRSQVRQDLKGGKSLTPAYAKRVQEQYIALARERDARRALMPGPPPPPEVRREEVPPPRIEVPEVDPRVVEQGRLDMARRGQELARSVWNEHSVAQHFPPGAIPTGANLQQIYTLALAKFREANARDAGRDDLGQQPFRNALLAAVTDFVRQQCEEIHREPYTPDRAIGYHIERAKVMSGLDAPDKAERMLTLLKARHPEPGLFEPRKLPSGTEITMAILSSLEVLPPPPDLGKDLVNNVRLRGECQKDIAKLGAALKVFDDQLGELKALRALVNREGVADPELLTQFNEQIDRRMAQLKDARNNTQARLFSYLTAIQEVMPVPTEAFNSLILPLLGNAPPEVRDACRNLLCNGFPRGEYLCRGEDPNAGRGRDERDEQDRFPWDPRMGRQVTAWHDTVAAGLREMARTAPDETTRLALLELAKQCGGVARPYIEGVYREDCIKGALGVIERGRAGQPLAEPAFHELEFPAAVWEYCDHEYSSGTTLGDAFENYQDFAKNFQILSKHLENPDNGLTPDTLHQMREAQAALAALERSCGEGGSLHGLLEHPDPNIAKIAQAFVKLARESRVVLDTLNTQLQARDRQVIPLRNTDLVRMDGMDREDLLEVVRDKVVFGADTSRKPDGGKVGLLEKNYIETVRTGAPVDIFYLRVGRGSDERDKDGNVHRSDKDRLTVLMPQVDTSGGGRDRLMMFNTGITRKEWDAYQAILDAYAGGRRRFSTDETELLSRVQNRLVFGMVGKKAPPLEVTPNGAAVLTRLAGLVAKNTIPPDLAARLGQALSDQTLRLSSAGRQREEFLLNLLTLCENGQPGLAAALLERFETLDLPVEDQMRRRGTDRPPREGEINEQRQDLYFFAKDALAHPEGYKLSMNIQPFTRLDLPGQSR